MLWCLWRIWSLAQHSIKVISYFSKHYIPNIHLQYALHINILQNTRITDQYHPFLAPPLCNIIMSTIEVTTSGFSCGCDSKDKRYICPTCSLTAAHPSFASHQPLTTPWADAFKDFMQALWGALDCKVVLLPEDKMFEATSFTTFAVSLSKQSFLSKSQLLQFGTLCSSWFTF